MEAPWQLQMFEKTVKKKQKVRLLTEMLGPLESESCLLVTGGDNNGAINYKLRENGGRWSWVEMEADGIDEMEELLGEPVQHADPDSLPFSDDAFDRVVVIDVHEHLHLEEVGPFNREIARVLREGGKAVVTTPNGDERLPLARVKRWVGMGPSVYGHVVQGYRTSELVDMMRGVDLEPKATGAYARFFTELVELGINFLYVKVLAKRTNGSEVAEGTIAPKTSDQLQSVGPAYRAYAALYPVVRAFSSLDKLLPRGHAYAVVVSAKKLA